MLDVLSTIVGAALLLVLLREVFHQLMHPEGRGTISVAILRAFRGAARRMGHRALQLAGPVSLGAVLITWFLLGVVGWALLLYPHMPGGYSFPGAAEPTSHPMVDSFYVSIVTISTLGSGDVVPHTPVLRLLGPLESVMGFGLLTASLTWLLSMYTPLARHRTLARLTHQHMSRDQLDGRHLDALATMVVATTVDMRMSPAICYFHAIDERECFARAALPLWDLAERIAGDDEAEARSDAAMLATALEEFAEALAEDFLPQVEGASTRAIFEEYARSDLRDGESLSTAVTTGRSLPVR